MVNQSKSIRICAKHSYPFRDGAARVHAFFFLSSPAIYRCFAGKRAVADRYPVAVVGMEHTRGGFVARCVLHRRSMRGVSSMRAAGMYTVLSDIVIR